MATTGRAVLFAGTGLILALLLATAIAPTKILTSLGIVRRLCSALAVGGAVVVMPAALVLFGRRLTGPPRLAATGLTRDWDRLVGAGAWVRGNAIVAGAIATAVLLALSVPALSLKTGPPDVSQLPKGDPARRAFEQVARVIGPGWPTPYNIIVVNPHGPITTAATLSALDSLQDSRPRSARRLGRRTGRPQRPDQAPRNPPRPAQGIEQAAHRRQERPAAPGERARAGRAAAPSSSRAGWPPPRRGPVSCTAAPEAPRAEPLSCTPGWPPRTAAPTSSPPGSARPSRAPPRSNGATRLWPARSN